MMRCKIGIHRWRFAAMFCRPMADHREFWREERCARCGRGRTFVQPWPL